MTRIRADAGPDSAPTPEARGRRSIRQRVRSWPAGTLIWRVGVTVVGVAVIAGGVILLPLPGPGWLVIFAGLGILASEYEWAARLLNRARSLVRGWTDWAARQGLPMRLVIGVLGLAFLVGVVYAAWVLST